MSIVAFLITIIINNLTELLFLLAAILNILFFPLLLELYLFLSLECYLFVIFVFFFRFFFSSFLELFQLFTFLISLQIGFSLAL